MKKNKLIRALTLILALVMLVCAAPSGVVYAEYSDDVVQATPSLKAINVYADEAMTERIDDLSTLRAGVRYYYTLECEPGEMLKRVAIAAKEADDRSFVAPCDGEVSEIYPQEGELVAMGTPIMSISKPPFWLRR